MPGLVDAHCHISFDEPFSNDELFFHRREGLAAIIAAYNVRKVLRAGVTTMFDADTIFDVSLDLRDAIECRHHAGDRACCAGGNALFTSVGGTAGLLVPDGRQHRLSQGNAKQGSAIVAEIRRQAERGADWIEVHVTGLIPRQRSEGEDPGLVVRGTCARRRDRTRSWAADRRALPATPPAPATPRARGST